MLQSDVKIPDLPPVPLAPMPPRQRAEMAEAMTRLRDQKHRPEVREYINTCYDYIWIHLCLARGIQPSQALNAKFRGFHDVLPSFAGAVKRIGAFPEKVSIEDWLAPHAAARACERWRRADAMREAK